jgi:simple sugar transport system ATP-binding protein
VATLSGGNQQKVIVARELTRPLTLLVAAQPTRGLDVGSIEFIHRQLIHERDIGTAVLLVSSELDEVLSLADRVAVMYRGRILAVVPPDTPREEVGLLMAGVIPGPVPAAEAGTPA